MSTKQSNASFVAYESSLSKPRRENKVMNILKSTNGCTINETIIKHRELYPNEIRDVSSIVVGLYYAGRLNRDEKNPRINPDSGKFAAVYYIPSIPLTKTEKLLRRLEKAKQDHDNALTKIELLQTELLRVGV